MFVPFHKGNGTGGTHGTSLGDYQEGRNATERIQTGFLVPLVPLVPHIPWNGTERNKLPGSRPILVPSVPLVPLIPWNGTRTMVWADRYGRSAPVTGESGHSQFAPLKLRSLALVPTSGAQSAPTNSTCGSSTVRLFLPHRSAPVRDSRPFRAPASPVLMRGVSDGRNVLPVPGIVPLSGQPAAGLSPPGRCAPSRPIKGKRLRDSCRPHAAAACRCPCHRIPEAGKRLALESPLAPQGEDNRPGSVVPRSAESTDNP